MPEKVNLDDIELFNNKMINLKQDFFDAIHPIGETYTQYPQQDDPNTLYNRNGVTCQWEKINYGGAFFRAEGGNANPYITKTDVLSIQGYQNAYHNHEYTPSGSVSSSFSGTRSKTDSDGSHSHTVSTTLDASSTGIKNEWVSNGIIAGQPSPVALGSSTASGGTSTDGSHKHGYTPSGSVSSSFSGNTSTTTYDGNSSNHEARPSNYTYVIWKRVS